MKKRVLAAIMTAAMICTGLAGCGECFRKHRCFRQSGKEDKNHHRCSGPGILLHISGSAGIRRPGQ